MCSQLNKLDTIWAFFNTQKGDEIFNSVQLKNNGCKQIDKNYYVEIVDYDFTLIDIEKSFLHFNNSVNGVDIHLIIKD